MGKRTVPLLFGFPFEEGVARAVKWALRCARVWRKMPCIVMKWNRRTFLGLTAAGLGGTALGGWGFWHHVTQQAPYAVVVEKYRLRLAHLAPAWQGLRIVQISDLHRSALVPEEYLIECRNHVLALQPDLIVLTGDFLSDDPELSRRQTLDRYLASLQRILAPLEARWGVMACLGNHDVAVEPDVISLALRNLGIRVLRDQGLVLRHPSAGQLAVVGLRDELEYPHVDAAFQRIPSDVPKLVLMHQPDAFAEWKGPDNVLIFSGHTHGGQVNIPGMKNPYLGGPAGGQFRAGVFHAPGRTMLVNRGLGMIRYPVRFRSAPEISLVELHAREIHV